MGRPPYNVYNNINITKTKTLVLIVSWYNFILKLECLIYKIEDGDNFQGNV